VLIGVPTGVKDGGGILEHLLREVEVECLPTDIPAKLEIDVSNLAIGDSLHVSDLKVERAEILTEADRAIAVCRDDPRGGRACGRGCRGRAGSDRREEGRGRRSGGRSQGRQEGKEAKSPAKEGGKKG